MAVRQKAELQSQEQEEERKEEEKGEGENNCQGKREMGVCEVGVRPEL